MKFIFSILALFYPWFLFTQTLIVNYNSDKSRADFDSMIMDESTRERMKKAYNNLLWHYTVKSDLNKVVCTLDSITQKCGYEESSSYCYKRIHILNRDSKWENFNLTTESYKRNTIYKIGNKHKNVFEIDYQNIKNILGFKCL